MRAGAVMNCAATLTWFQFGATCAFEPLRTTPLDGLHAKDSSVGRSRDPMGRLRLARTEMLQVLQFRFQTVKLPGQLCRGVLDSVAQHARRRLGAQVDGELATLNRFVHGL